PGAGQPIQSPLYEGATHQLHEGLGLIGAQPGATARRGDDGHHGQRCSISLGKHVSPGALYSADHPARGWGGHRGCYLLSSSSRSMAASPSVSAARAAAACSRWRSMVSCISASSASAFLSSTPSASASSPTRIWRALASMRFSPADRPLSWPPRHRSRTTSATLFWSPEVRRSWLALYRRDQLPASSTSVSRSTEKTLSRPSSPTTSRTPTFSAFAAGTRTERSPW